MRKKILAAIVAATMADGKLASSKSSNDKENNSLKKTEDAVVEEVETEEVIEEVTEEVKVEESISENAKINDATSEVNISEEINIEETTIEETIVEEIPKDEAIVEDIITIEQPVIEQPAIEEIKTVDKVVEIQNKFAYEFEGRYWLRYSAYGHLGWYFDGSVAICQSENQGTYVREYFVEGDLINIGGECYRYEISNGRLGLALARDEMGYFSYYDEVDKGEYDSLFNR